MTGVQTCALPISTIAGSAASLLFLSTIEVFDGFSDNWGFSTGDMIANTGGTMLYAAQKIAWHEPRIVFKFSYHETKYACIRQDQLGSNFTERLFKDYNGQTYWLSANIGSFMKSSSKFPKWLNVATGYSADGLTGARANPEYTPGYIERHRQFFIAPDIDLTKLKTRKKFVRGLLTTFGFIKFPAPAIEFRDDGMIRAHWLYF